MKDFQKELERRQMEEEKEAQPQRAIARKSKNPMSNRRDFDEENKLFGVTSEVDLLL